MKKQIIQTIQTTAILLLIFLACSVIFADTHYVSQTGGNSPPYTNWATAAHIFQNAVNAAESNDIVLVADGVYDSGGGICNDARGDVCNSIIYFNNAPNYTNYYQFYIVFQSCCSEPRPPGTGNIGGYPLFQDIYSADYHLLKMSPCIDAGNNSLTNCFLFRQPTFTSMAQKQWADLRLLKTSSAVGTIPADSRS